MRLTPVDQDIDAGRKYLNERSLQIGHVLPLSEETFKEYFPEKSSFLLYSVRAVDALFCFRGYDRKRLQALRALDYKVGASIPGTVSLDGKRFDLHYLYKELDDHYHFSVRRSHAKPGLYPILEVEKAKNQRLVLRGYRKEDRPFLDKAATHLNVIRGIANGVFEGSVPWGPGVYEEWFEKRRVFPIVCEDESIGEPVGLLDLFRVDPDVMQHVMDLGMYVRAEYHGLGVGTLLMDAMKTLAKRLNLSRVALTVFEGNAPAEKLYAKAGFIKCGRLPGWPYNLTSAGNLCQAS